MSSPLFGFAVLGEFLGRVGNRFSWSRMGDWSGQRVALLRHDVDLDLEPAARLARQLAEWGIPSTFFVLVTCPHYNPLAARSRQLLEEIGRLGCEVGLHFDPTVYAGAEPQDLQRAAQGEAAILERASGQPVRSLSLHNPHSMFNIHLYEGFINAYDPRIFAPDRYLSDSCRRFRQDPEAFLARVQDAQHPIQILLHPLHYDQSERDYQHIFADYWARRRHQCDADFRAANSTYGSEVENR